MKIRFGTNRLVFIFKDYVIKFPLFSRGRIANYLEYVNYVNHKDIVAKVEHHWLYIKQERLTNLQVFKYKEKNFPKYLQHLVPFIIHSRMQIGQDKNGTWKFYDYEDSKYYLKNYKKGDI